MGIATGLVPWLLGRSPIISNPWSTRPWKFSKKRSKAPRTSRIRRHGRQPKRHRAGSAKEEDPTLEAAIEDPITVSLGPVGPLLQKLNSVGPELCPPEDIRLLKMLCISLKDLLEDEAASCTAQWWMKIVRELCYDVEDHLDGVSGSGAHHDFSELLARVTDATERRERFQWSPKSSIKQDDSGKAGDSSHRTSPDPELLVPTSGRRIAAVVEPPNELVKLLALDDGEETLKVIPINGCAGVGKTMVARTLYHKYGGDFQCRAFVSMTQNPDMKSILSSMLSQLKAPQPCGFPDVPDLIDAIMKHLQDKRYFIIIDNVWTASVWDIISEAFPRGGRCSRIITTTQIADVALACCSYDLDNIYKMGPLDDYASRQLFFGRVFGSEDGCPADMKEMAYEIVKKCGGLPLLLVNVASLLARENWKHLDDFLRSTSHGMKDVLNFMYDSLSPSLRTCFLYLSMFPEGYVIKKDELVKYWLAEDFLSAVEGEEIAASYFDELVSTGMVQAMDTNNNGEVLSCTVHQVVLDFIRCKSMEENFVITVNYLQSTLALPEKVRRLSVQFGGVKSAYIPEGIITSQVRSFIFWGFLKCVPSVADYGLLRVLTLHIWADQDKTSFDLTRIGQLFRLKYLKIECNIAVKLPDKVQSLQQLGTLHVDARLLSVPQDIVNLERLRHLRLPSESILPNGIENMTSLRTLGYFDLSTYSQEDVMRLGQLTNLKDLQLTCSAVQSPVENLKKNLQLLGFIIQKLSVLQSVTLVPASGSCFAANIVIPCDGFSMVSPPSDLLLRRVELSWRCCIFFRLPKWFGQLSELCTLKIAIRGLSGGDIDILKGLPSLTALTLYIQTAPAERIVISNVGFQVLTYFKFVCPAPCLSFVEGAMPNVQKLDLGFNENKMEPQSLKIAGFLHLTGLVDICVKFGVPDAEEFDIKAAKSTLEDAVSNCPNTPTIRVLCSDMIFYGEEDESTETEGREDTSVKKRQEIREGKKKNIEDSEQHVVKQLSNSPTRCSRVDLVTGAMDSLLPKLEHLKSLHKDQLAAIDSLNGNLQTILGHLRKTVEVQPDQREVWANQVRDLSYDAEDTVDSILVSVEGSEPDTKQDGIVEIVRRAIRRRNSRSKSQKIVDKINDIIGRVNDVVGRSESYKRRNEERLVPNPTATPISDPLFSALNEEPRKLVGIEASRDEVIRKLRMNNDTTQLVIVSIAGMGGLGKTTLAKAVYYWAEGKFDCRAFVSVSRHPDMERVFRDILIQIDREKYMNINAVTLKEDTLIKELRGLLAEKRYLIVIDDVWDIQSWEKIQSALIDNRYGSKVITTSRILYVTTKASEVYMLKPLSTELSRELFHTISFGGKGKCMDALLKVSEDIVRKCDGLPLAISIVAKLLVGKSSDEWSKMSNCLDCGYEQNEDLVNMRSILISSYYDMPYHLRTCLLYLHIFPKGRLIEKETLIWKWIAEGLIAEEPGTRSFDHGEKCFNELLERSLIMPIEDQRRRGIIVGCHVQLVVHESICYLSKAEDFVTVLENKQQTSSQLQHKARRLAIQDRDTELYPLGSTPIKQVRSFNATRCLLSTALSLSSFEVLRVLAIEGCTFTERRACQLEHIGGLIHLKYLGMYKSQINELPEEIGNLRILQTLDLRSTGVRELPHRVRQLSQLKCLRADDVSTRVPDWIGELTSLEELQLEKVGKSIKFVKELGKLTELRGLKIETERFDGNSTRALVESISNLQKIQVLCIESGFSGVEDADAGGYHSSRKTNSDGEETNWESFVPPRQLRDVRMKVASFKVPAWINSSRLPNLSHLSVEVKTVGKQDLEHLGSFQQLISLELFTPLNFFPTIYCITGSGAFPKLRHFEAPVPVKFVPGAMPCLEFLGFKVYEHGWNTAHYYFDTLANLSLLQKVEVKIAGPDSYIQVVCEAVRRALDNHCNCPDLLVHKTDQVEITASM